MTPALASKTLKLVGVSCVLGIAVGTIGSLGIPPSLRSSAYPTCSRGAVSRGGLTQASPTVVGAGAGRSIPICLPSPMTPVPGTNWCTSRAIALFCSGEGGH